MDPNQIFEITTPANQESFIAKDNYKFSFNISIPTPLNFEFVRNALATQFKTYLTGQSFDEIHSYIYVDHINIQARYNPQEYTPQGYIPQAIPVLLINVAVVAISSLILAYAIKILLASVVNLGHGLTNDISQLAPLFLILIAVAIYTGFLDKKTT